TLTAMFTPATWPNGDPIVPQYSWQGTSNTTSTFSLSTLNPPIVAGVVQLPLLVRPFDQGPVGGEGGATGGADFQDLGYITATATTLTVTLSNYANGSVVAGNVWLQPIVGNGGADDDFHVAPDSPTIDAGNPADPVGLEPAPNGGRINLGSDGGTA